MRRELAQNSHSYYPPLRTQVKKSKNSHRDPESSGLALFASGGWDFALKLCTKVKNLLKERLENREIYIAIGGLSDSELNRAYASLTGKEEQKQSSRS
jgi:hypothetical protein